MGCRTLVPAVASRLAVKNARRHAGRSDGEARCGRPPIRQAACYRAGVKALRTGSAFLAAVISCILGVASLAAPDRSLPHAPVWRGVIAPLAGAPLPHGAPVGLIDQLGASRSDCRFLLLEAAWRRPDVWWTPMPEFPLDSHYDTVVTTDDRPPAPGWRETWESGTVRLFRRTSR